uniref:polyhydroxyalkanoate depolymerase n=1 Tax=Dokdonella sp. TaxID=2291710 RepID=UPI00262EDBE4
MLYHLHEVNRALLNPWVTWSGAAANALTAPENWLSKLPGVDRLAAGYELFYRLGKDYEKPAFGITEVEAHGREAAVIEERLVELPFCRLLHFKRTSDDPAALKKLREDPTVLVVAPLSGHHATLLRDTVRTLLRDHDVCITDWIDARMIPVDQGAFGLDDYVAYVRRFIQHLGAEKLHVMSVCQPTVPVLGAISLMAAAGETTPLTMTMMGGPIDARRHPTQVNDLATTKPFSWFETSVVFDVPPNYPGKGRKVYPGFLQHAGFVAMNPSRHFSAHWDYYMNLLRGDLDDAAAHRRFYDEYNAVLDLPAEFYLDTIRTVFQEFSLPRGTWVVGGERVAPKAISRTALLTIEGQLDDISGLGQTKAAHDLC